MKVIKPQSLGVLHRAYEDGNKFYFSVGVMMFFPFASPQQLLTEASMWKFVAQELDKDASLDQGMPKPRGEVLLHARCFAPGGVPTTASLVRVQLGHLDKRLLVSGDRRWFAGGRTAPVPFVELPISYERAYGGPNYALNPLGIGFAPIAAPNGSFHPLPNIEAWDGRVESSLDEVAPAGFGPLDFVWPQRFSKAGTYDQRWFAEQFPGFAADMDWTVFNAAPADQQIDGFFRGDESFALWNMHPTQPLQEGVLPGLLTRCFITQKTGAAQVLREITTRLETVWLFPAAERGVLMFRGVVEVETDDAADVLHLLIAAEEMGAAKPVEHYARILAQRLDKQRGHLYLLRDGDLLPPPKPGARRSVSESQEMEELLKTENLMGQNFRRRAERERAAAAKQLIDRGLDPAEFLPAEPELALPVLSDPAALPEYIEQIEALAAEQFSKAEVSRAEATAQARLLCEQNGLLYDQIMNPDGGPPRFSAAEELLKMQAMAQSAREQGLVIEEVEAALTSPAFSARLYSAEQKLREFYLQAAHHFPPAAPLSSESASSLRSQLGSRKDLAGCDLTGADLSGLDLRAANLKGTLLEGANLTRTDLRNADLSGAVLARAELNATDLRGANLTDANLGAARLTNANLDGANLRRAILGLATIEGASFRDAELAEVNFMEVVAKNVDLSGAHAPQLTFIRVKLHGLQASRADLRECIFIETDLTDSDFSATNLTSALFVRVAGERAKFRGATLTNLRVVEETSFQGGDFAMARLDGANLRGTKLAGCDFSDSQMPGADFSECDLRAADLRRAVAREARFVRADLSAAQLVATNFMQAMLSQANLEGANLRGANLFRADLARAKTNLATCLHAANLTQIRTTREWRHGSF